MPRSLRITYLLLIAFAFLGLAACEDPVTAREVPDETDGGGGPWNPPMSGGFPGPAGDVEDTVEDAGGDIDHALDTREPDQCNRTPIEHNELHLWPCCFSDLDCFASPYPESNRMRCYGVRCTEGGEGVCRVTPHDPTRCWDDKDCIQGFHCRFAVMVGCGEDPASEQAGTCVED
ncbi:MAG: hypothetical protein ACNA8W_22230 [Bradymonadaceae bacterium]